jgi:hypothetical protein
MKTLVFAFGLITATATPTGPVVPSATSAPADNPAIDRLAVTYWNQLGTGTLDKSELTPEFAAGLTPRLLTQIRAGIRLMGKVASFRLTVTGRTSGVPFYGYTLIFANGVRREFYIWVTPAGKIAGSRIVK